METREKNNNEIIVLAPVVQKYIFAKKFKGDDAREVYKAVAGRVAKDFKNLHAFNTYFKFNEGTGEINGSNLYYGILINDELRASGLHLPSVTEGKSLDSAKKLSDGVYRDYGLVVYNGQNPNSNIAQRLIREAKKKEWKTPILALSFDALKLKKDASVLFSGDTKNVLTGEEAQKYLDEQFNYKGNSGVLRLGRDGDGGWGAHWYDLGDSYADGRVDWVCGEATTQDLERVVAEEIDKVARNEAEKLNAKIASSKETALKILRS